MGDVLFFACDPVFSGTYQVHPGLVVEGPGEVVSFFMGSDGEQGMVDLLVEAEPVFFAFGHGSWLLYIADTSPGGPGGILFRLFL